MLVGSLNAGNWTSGLAGFTVAVVVVVVLVGFLLLLFFFFSSIKCCISEMMSK